MQDKTVEELEARLEQIKLTYHTQFGKHLCLKEFRQYLVEEHKKKQDFWFKGWICDDSPSNVRKTIELIDANDFSDEAMAKIPATKQESHCVDAFPYVVPQEPLPKVIVRKKSTTKK